jgi:Domain of unknown function (DUF4272)
VTERLTRHTKEVLTRALCLAAVVSRSVAEDFIATGDSSPGFDRYMGVEPKHAPSVIAKWVEREGFAQAFSSQEKAYMAKPAGQWTRQETINGSWRREALVTLEWALQIVQPMPLADVQIPMEDVLEGAWLLKETSGFRKKASLLPPAEIHKQRDVAEFWLWRSRTWKLQHYSEEKLREHKVSKEKLRAIADHAAAKGEKDGLFRCIEGDFPAFGKPFRALDDREWTKINSILTERLYGLNWICNIDGLEWDNVETST